MVVDLTHWYADFQPDQRGNRVYIEGRGRGIGAFFAKLFGTPIRAGLRVDGDNLYFQEATLDGSHERVIPLRNISSTYFGYTRPGREALTLTFTLVWLFGLGLIIGPLYYLLKRNLTVGVVEMGGIVSAMQFRRSVVRATTVDEAEARRVIQVLRAVLQERQDGTRSPSPSTGAGYSSQTPAPASRHYELT